MDSCPSSELSLVIPAWNEESVLEQAIGEALVALPQVANRFELIVVDDGSTDGTAEIAARFAASDSRVRLVRQSGNCGYGAALRAGFEAARCELVAFTDADCQFELTDLGYMLPLASRYDMVYGFRIDRKDPALRRFLSWGYNQVIRLLLGSPVRDVDCALKIFRRDQLQQLLPDAKGFFANTEMISRAKSLGRSVVEVGVTHRPRASGESKVRMSDVPRTLSSLLPYWWSRVLNGPVPTPDFQSL